MQKYVLFLSKANIRAIYCTYNLCVYYEICRNIRWIYRFIIKTKCVKIIIKLMNIDNFKLFCINAIY